MRSHFQLTFALVSSIIVLSGCSGDKLPKYSVLQSLRVLALPIDAPELDFDGTTFTPNSVNVTPWVSDLYGSGRTLKINLYWCVDPGVGAGATPTCTGNPSRTQVVTDQTVVATATFLNPNYTGALTPQAVSFAALSSGAATTLAAKYAALTPAQAFNGYSILIFFEIYPVGSLDEKVVTFKRLVFSGAAKVTKNTNPTGLEIRAAGTEIAALPTVLTSLEAYLPANQAETYSFMDGLGNLSTQTETLETAWFLSGPYDIACSRKKECTSDGYFSRTLTRLGELNTFTPPVTALPTARGRILVGVAKDGRGGEMVKRYCDGVCP